MSWYARLEMQIAQRDDGSINWGGIHNDAHGYSDSYVIVQTESLQTTCAADGSSNDIR